MMIVTMLFCWEIGAGVLLTFLLAALVYCSERRRAGGRPIADDPEGAGTAPGGGVAYRDGLLTGCS